MVGTGRDVPLSRFLNLEGFLSTTTVVVLVLLTGGVVTHFRKMPKALLIRNGKLRNFAYTFVTSFPTDLPSQIFDPEGVPNRYDGCSCSCCYRGCCYPFSKNA